MFRSILSLLLQFLRAVDCQKLDANKTKTPPIKKQINFNFLTIVCPSKLWEVFGTFKVSLLLLLLSSRCCCFRLRNFDSVVFVVVLFFFDQSRDDFFVKIGARRKKAFPSPKSVSKVPTNFPFMAKRCFKKVAAAASFLPFRSGRGSGGGVGLFVCQNPACLIMT